RTFVRRVSSQSTRSASASSRSTRSVTSSRFPIGVAQTASNLEGLEPDEAGADEPSVGAEQSGDDAHEVPAGRESLELHRLQRRLEEEVASLAEPASDHDHLGIEDVHERAESRPEPSPDLAHRLQRLPVSVPRRADELPAGGVRPEQLHRLPVSRATRRDLLEVAVTGAVAGARLAPVREHHVPDLGAPPDPAAIRLAGEEPPG